MVNKSLDTDFFLVVCLSVSLCLHCPVYRNLRTRYLVNYNRNISDQEKWFASNMNDKTQESVLGMAKFLFFALQLRLKKMNGNS